MKIFFGVDYRGQEQKENIAELLSRYGEVVDVIAADSKLENYVQISQRVAESVRDTNDSVGVLMCGTGGGTSIVANKHKGIYAVRCFIPEDAIDAKIINNANILCLSARVLLDMNLKIIEAFLTTQYQGRKPERLQAIKDLENENFQ